MTVTVAAPVLLWSRSGAVGIATLNRPEALNALTVELLAELDERLEEAAADPSVRALVLAGGERAFSVGADLRTLDREYAGAAEPDELVEAMRRTFARLDAFPLPVVAAVNGWCLGGGLELALVADLCVAGEDARFGLPEAKVGALPGAGGTQRLPRLVGARRAKELMLVGKPIDAAEALRIGLVNRVVPAAAVPAEAVATAAAIAANGPLAVRAIKQAVDRGLELPLAEGLSVERELHVELRESGDRREGVRAFVEKRAPRFEGR